LEDLNLFIDVTYSKDIVKLSDTIKDTIKTLLYAINIMLLTSIISIKIITKKIL